MKCLFSFLAVILIFACAAPGPPKKKKLPIIGNKEVVNGDTIYHTIPDFSFIDQDSNLITNGTFKDKAYVVDFFFISCPTICPKTTKQMLRIYDQFKEEDGLKLVAHTVDPKRDSVAALKLYAHNLNVDSDRWHFVTGDKSDIYDIAEEYFSVAKEDPDAPGGFDHSGRFILVDKNRMVRSFCNGTDPGDVDRFMEDIQILLDEG